MVMIVFLTSYLLFGLFLISIMSNNDNNQTHCDIQHIEPYQENIEENIEEDVQKKDD